MFLRSFVCILLILPSIVEGATIRGAEDRENYQEIDPYFRRSAKNGKESEATPSLFEDGTLELEDAKDSATKQNRDLRYSFVINRKRRPGNNYSNANKQTKYRTYNSRSNFFSRLSSWSIFHQKPATVPPINSSNLNQGPKYVANNIRDAQGPIRVDFGQEAPRNEPTVSPTGPTAKPTDPFPTESPTHFPTRNPTQRPTNEPTANPTISPTRKPTVSPTFFPTRNPTRRPTPFPTPSPTRAPTHKPTQSPTFFPTRVPTRRPTPSPTASPSKTPSSQPSDP